MTNERRTVTIPAETMQLIEKRLLAEEEATAEFQEWKDSIDKLIETNKDMVKVANDMLAAMRLLGLVGRGIKWIAGVSIAATVIWQTAKGFHIEWGGKR